MLQVAEEDDFVDAEREDIIDRRLEDGGELRHVVLCDTVGIAEVFLDDVFKGIGTVVELVVADGGRIEADDVHDRDIDAAFAFAKRVECVRAEQFIVSVVEDAAIQPVIACAADQDVIAVPAFEDIATGKALEGVGIAVALDLVVEVGADGIFDGNEPVELEVPTTAEACKKDRAIIVRQREGDAIPKVDGDARPVVGVARRIVAASAVQEVVAASAIDLIVARQTENKVSAPAA